MGISIDLYEINSNIPYYSLGKSYYYLFEDIPSGYLNKQHKQLIISRLNNIPISNTIKTILQKELYLVYN